MSVNGRHFGSRPGYIQKRSVGMKYLQKLDDAARAWAERAERIKQGKEQNTFAMLEERGYIKDLAGQQSTVLEMFRVKRVGAYVGIDPTADSLHVGHLLPLMPLFWMYMHGYRTFSLIGGATVKIGDPTDRLKSRDPIKPADLTMYMTKMHYQVKKLWVNVDDVARLYGYKWEWAWKRALVNNNTWWNSLPMLEVLKRVGSAMRIGPMLSRDTVKNKLEKGDGMSFAEFTYPIMQGWDWWHMFSRNGIQLQIGGSDQYGNIVSGIDIVKAARDNETDPAKVIPRDSKLDDPVGFTVPLLTDSSGAKFGKSAGNAIWLDKFKTSVFDFYGYWVRQPDHDVEKLLKLFTFQSLDKIREIMAEHEISPEKRVAQHVLAFEVTRLVHGSKEAKQAQMDHQQMYGRPNQELASSAQYMAEDGHPTTLNNAPRVDMQLPESLIMGKSISKILYAAGLVSSTSEGHRIAVKKGAYIGGMPGHSRARTSEARVMDPGMLTFTPIHLWFPQDTQNYLIDGKLLILRRGKHNVRVIEMVSDEEYKASGQTYPGQPYTGAVRQLQNMLKKLKKKEASAKEVRDFLGIEEQAEEDDDPALIKFPEEKKPQILFWEQKIQQMLEEREAEEKPKGAEESEKKSE